MAIFLKMTEAFSVVCSMTTKKAWHAYAHHFLLTLLLSQYTLRRIIGDIQNQNKWSQNIHDCQIWYSYDLY